MKKLQMILAIALTLQFGITFGQVTKTDTLNNARNTDFDFLELKGYEVSETARIFNDFDNCKANIEIKDTEIAVKDVLISKKDDQIASLVKAHYYSDVAIKKSDTINNANNIIKSLQKEKTNAIEGMSTNFEKMYKSQKLKKNIYKFSFIATLIYLGKVIFIK